MKAVLLIALLALPAATGAADVWVYWIDPAISTEYSRLKRT